MPALTNDRNTPRRERGETNDYGVAADAVIFAGALTVLAAGYAAPGSTALNLIAVGRAEHAVDNTGGADGAVTVKTRAGVYRFANSSAADLIGVTEIGKDCYIVDDQTVAKTSATNTRSVAGKVVDVDAQGVWVAVGIVL